MSWKKLDFVAYEFNGRYETFLNDISTANKEMRSAGFLDRFGKLIALCLIIKKEGGIYLILSKFAEPNFIEHMKKYFPYEGLKIRKSSLKVIYSDSKEELSWELSNGYVNLSIEYPISDEISDTDFNEIRINSNFTIQGIDFENPVIVETNWICIDDKKGCYLGQEIIARIKAYGKPSRKLVKLQFEKLPIIIQNGVEIKPTTVSNNMCFATMPINSKPKNCLEIDCQIQ